MNRYSIYSCILILALLPACSSRRSGKCVKQESIVSSIFWTDVFHDKLLQSTLQQLLQQNIDIKIAQTRVKQARAYECIARAQYFPDVAAAGRALVIPRLLIQSSPTQVEELPGGASTVLLGGVTSNWELDVFGKTRAAVRAATHKVRGQQAEVNDAIRIVVADLCKAYIDWVQYRSLVAMIMQTIELQNDLVNVYKDQHVAGLTDAVSYENALVQQASLRAALLAFEGLQEAAVNTIEFLVGKEIPALHDVAEHSLPELPSLTHLGESSVLVVKQRPDVIAAYEYMCSFQDELGKAEAALWPSVSVSSFLGLIKTFNSIIKQSNPFYIVAPFVNLPFLDFGRLRCAVRAADARAQEASFEYEKTVLKALEEVRTALTQAALSAQSYTQVVEAYQAQQRIQKLMDSRYKAGLVNGVDDIQSKLIVLQAEATVIIRQAQALQDYIRSAKALASR